MEIIKFDNLMKKNFQACNRFFYWRHIRDLTVVKSEPSWPLLFGLAGHAGLERHFKLLRDEGRTDVEEVLKAFLGEFKEEQKAPILKSGKEGEAVYTRVRGCFILQEYLEHYKVENFKVVDVEIGFAEELEEGVVYCGRIDLLTESKDGVRGWDHKFTSRMDRFTMSPNNQFMGYQWAGGKFFKDFAGMVGDIVGVYKNKLSEEIFDRQYERYNGYQMEQWRKEVLFVAAQIRVSGEMGVWPKNTDHCGAYSGRCMFLPLCTAVNKESEETLVRNMYKVEKWEPYMEGGGEE